MECPDLVGSFRRPKPPTNTKNGPHSYRRGGFMFKPTKARVKPFRTTLDGAVSYFIGGDPNFSEDHGFALNPWTAVRFEPAGTTQLSPSLAITMGHYIEPCVHR